MKKKSWDELTNDEKLDRLTSALTLAGSDVHFRDRCLASPESAKSALTEICDVEFPPDFKVQFLTPEERVKTLILALPEYVPPQDGQAEIRHAEDYQPCTYATWRG